MKIVEMVRNLFRCSFVAWKQGSPPDGASSVTGFSGYGRCKRIVGHLGDCVPDDELLIKRNVEPIPEHIEKQRKQGPPFYCGTAFCGHATEDAAAKCWKNKCDALKKIQDQAEELRKQGKRWEADELYISQSARYFPEQDPRNWPINRSSKEMQREYIERAKGEQE